MFSKKQIIRIFILHKYFLTTLLVCLFLIFLANDRIIYFDFWAEDGRLFLLQYYNFSFTSFFMPYSGYFHVIPRILTAISYHLSIEFMPFIQIITCTIITSLIFALPVQNRFKWIFGKLDNRLILSLFLVTTAGMSEVFGNITNIHWVLLLAMLLIGLTNYKSKLSYGDLLLIFLFSYSESVTFIVLPFYLFRTLKRYPIYKLKGCWNDLIAIFIIGSSNVVNVLINSNNTLTTIIEFPQLIRIYFSSMMKYEIIRPMLGDWVIKYMMFSDYLLAFLVVMCFSLLLYFLKKAPNKIITISLLLITGPILIVLISIFRPSDLFLGNPFPSISSMWIFNIRYGFYLSAIGALVLFTLFSFIKSIVWLRTLRVLLITLILFSGFSRMKYNAYNKKQLWKIHYSKVYELIEGKRSEVSIPTNPANWYIDLPHMKNH